jgi:hypothetical protein
MDEDKLKWIPECHDFPVAGYPGQAKSQNLLSQRYSWNQIRKNMERLYTEVRLKEFL